MVDLPYILQFFPVYPFQQHLFYRPLYILCAERKTP